MDESISTEGSQSELKMWHKSPQVLEDDDSITIYKSERIGIPSRVIERYFSDHNGVKFYATGDRDKIALQPCSLDDPNAYKLQVGNTGSKAMVTASSFLEYIGVDYDETVEIPAEWDDDRNVLLVNISDDRTK